MMQKNIIFLHGGPGFSNYLHPFFEKLDVKANLIFYDQLKGPSIKLANLLDQLDQVVCSLEGETILVGHSWGSTLAIEYTSQHRSKISSLVLISSGLSFKHWKSEFESEKTEVGLSEAPPEKIFLSDAERDNWTGFLNDLWNDFSGETFDSLYESYVTTHDLTDQFSKLSMPILYIYGTEDHRFPSRVAKTIKTYNQGVEDFEVQGAGHFPFLLENHRSQVSKKIRDFTDNF